MANSDAVVEQIRQVWASIETLATGLDQIVGTLATHTTMLSAIMQAAAPADDGSPLKEALDRLAQATEALGGSVERNNERIAELTAAVQRGGQRP